MVQIKAWAKTSVFCTFLWLPLIIFFIATTGLFFTITPSGCSPSVLKGFLPPPSREYYGISNVTSWYYTSEWQIFPTRGVCPLGAKTGVTTDKQTGKQKPGDFQSCLPWTERPWAIIDKYNTAADVKTSISMVTSYEAFRSSYQAILAAIAISGIMISAACTNIFFSLNSPTGRHSVFSLLLFVEMLAYFLIMILACVAVGAAGASSIVLPAAWSTWFPSCLVTIKEREVPGLLYWLLFMGFLMLGTLLIGEITHRMCGKCLTRRVALEGVLSNSASGYGGQPPFADSGFTKSVADWRIRVMREAFFGDSGATFTQNQATSEGGDDSKLPDQRRIDVIPKRDAAPRL